MKDYVINKPLLEKDIDSIILFAQNENNCYSKIISAYNECCNGYKSSNKSLLLNDSKNVDNLKRQINNKRSTYTNILKKVIIQYVTLTEKMKNTIKGYKNE